VILSFLVATLLAQAPAPPPQPAPAPAPEPAAEPAPEDLSSTTVGESPIALTTRVTPDPSQIGDLLKLEVTAAYPAGYAVNIPLGLKMDPLHLVSVDESEPESTGQGFRKVFTITLQHFNVGPAKTPKFELTYVSPNGEVQTVAVPPHEFTVTALLANEAEPKRQGEDPPVSLEYPNTWAETAIYVAAAALVAGFISALLWMRWRRRPRPVVLPPPEPPDRVALRALDRLQEADYVARGEFQIHYLLLTEIMKGYLEGRFGIDALERTTDELRRTLLNSDAQIAPLKPTDVVRFLQQCDLVKFARFAPPPSEAAAAVDQAREMVKSTTPEVILEKAENKDKGTGPDKPAPKDKPPETGPSGKEASP
jgi:hypothetical protein